MLLLTECKEIRYSASSPVHAAPLPRQHESDAIRLCRLSRGRGI